MQQTQFYSLGGGLDLVSPPLSVTPGRMIAGFNYEPTLRGYRRCDGYERFDGHTKPSSATYYTLNFDAGSGAIVEGDVVTGGTSGATGIALVDAVLLTGSYGDGDAVGYIVLTAVAGTFVNDESLEVSATPMAVAFGVAVSRGADNDDEDKTWYRAAIELARNQIAAVPGSGTVRGVWSYNGVTYAFRDNVGATACLIYKSTSSGWTAVDLGRQVAFTSGGTYEVSEGDTIEGATSGATAVVGRVILNSGTWAGGDAAGILILTSQTGTFQSENLNVGAHSNVATIAGNSTAHTLLPGGRYRFVNSNFYASSNYFRMYGCDGVNKAFEFDGEVFVPITTGMPVDAPTHIAAHKKHLFLAFPGGSLQSSGIGEPTKFTVILGASEIGIGQEITGLLSSVSGILVVFGRNTVAVLYGSSVSDWQLVTQSEDSGCIENTAQMIGNPIYMDDSGLRDLRTTQAFGDFKLGAITTLIEPMFDQKRSIAVTATESIRVRQKTQYRLFWSDGTGITVYFGKKQPEIAPFDLGIVVRCACSSEDLAGNEIMFFGADDGFVYQLDAGTSFDGEAVQAFMRLPFNHLGSPHQNKRFHKVTLELDADASTSLGLTAEFTYADPDQPAAQSQSFTVQGSGGFWDEANWDEFYWSSPASGKATAFIDGIGTNVGIAVISTATYERPHIIHGLQVHYTARGLAR
jgi:hypothetical protein